MSVDIRVAVFSDVHGNLAGLDAVLRDIDNHGPFDRVIAAGDYCLKGPDPAACADLVLERSDEVLVGNTDADIVDADLDTPAYGRKKKAAICWTREQLGDDRIWLITDLAFSCEVVAPDESHLLVVHANPRDVTRHIFPDMPDEELAQLLNGCETDVLVFGHLHVPYVRRHNGIQLFDIAASGLPQDGDRRAAWGAFEWSAAAGWKGTIHRVDYDYGATVLRMLDSGMPHPTRRIRDLVSASYA